MLRRYQKIGSLRSKQIFTILVSDLLPQTKVFLKCVPSAEIHLFLNHFRRHL